MAREPVPEPVLGYTAPPDDGAPQDLQDYRHVRLNDPSHDRTYGEMDARRLKNADPVKFGMMLARMEREFRERGTEGGPKVRDMGTERARELVKMLLDKFEAQEAKRGG